MLGDEAKADHDADDDEYDNANDNDNNANDNDDNANDDNDDANDNDNNADSAARQRRHHAERLRRARDDRTNIGRAL